MAPTASPSSPTSTSTSSGPSDSLMARLKADTAHLHARIEQVVPLLRGDLDGAGLRRHLEQLLGFVAPLEARLARFAEGFLGWGVDLAARRRTALLGADLAHLGASPESLAALPACQALPAAASLDEAWGCLYVLEGSTLGGQLLLRTLAPRLGLTATRGLRYLAGHGEHTGARWKELAGATERFAAAGCDRDAVVRGARETFATQIAWLGGGEVQVG